MANRRSAERKVVAVNVHIIAGAFLARSTRNSGTPPAVLPMLLSVIPFYLPLVRAGGLPAAACSRYGGRAAADVQCCADLQAKPGLRDLLAVRCKVGLCRVSVPSRSQ